MNISAIFVKRKVATTLLTAGIALAGLLAYSKLPVAPLPKVDYPTIVVTAQQPGASPETMSTSVATPLERHLGAIADVSEMTSTSTVGSTRITLQFGLDRDIDGAARDVQAAINAARADLPTSLRSNPTYRKINPSDAPIMILALTSDILTQGQLYDSAATVIQQALSQVSGVGDVQLGGSSLPAVRVELEPRALFKYGIGLEDVRAALAAANANAPKGAIEEGGRHYQVYTNDQARSAAQYRSLVIAYRNGAAVRLSDVAEVADSVEDLRNQGLANGKPAVLAIISREPGANIIETVDRVKALLPVLQASMPAGVDVSVALDRTTTIRASLDEVQITLLIAVALVILVVFLFLRDARATLIPGITVPVSLLGTLGVMYLLGYSLDNLSLMALTIVTGFVVDDAIVVLENITRHLEAGMPRLQAAVQGAREVGFTVFSMSISLIAVFIPILLMGGLIGRLFHEFAVTLSIAILISLLLSLTTTPMMCAYMIRGATFREGPNRLHRATEHLFESVLTSYDRSLAWALRHGRIMMLILLGVLVLMLYLFVTIPKGFFPQQDTGRLIGGLQADQSISFQLMRQKLTQFIDIIKRDKAVDTVVGFTGGARTNSGFVFVQLKPRADRGLSADQVIARLRRELAVVPGAALFLQSVQDIRVGGRQSNAQYQYTLQADDIADLRAWAPKIAQALEHVPELTDVNSDQQDKGLEIDVAVDRATASRLGLKMSQINGTLYDAFGQRQVSTIYNPLNQYHVIMEVAPRYWQSPDTLKDIYVSTSGGAASGTQGTNALTGTVARRGGPTTTAAQIANDVVRNENTNRLANTGRGGASTGAAVSTSQEIMIPLAAFAQFAPGSAPLAVNHQGQFLAATISFNLASGVSLSNATAAIDRTMNELHVPVTIHGTFQGTAGAFQKSLDNQPILILAALIAVYVVLGILYESYIHPITILSTLPSAGVGAVLALMAFRTEFSIMALIGVILLIGIVKKNAIIMIDFAIDAECQRKLSPREAIAEACHLRFRPIMMTTMAALFGAVPLAVGIGEGSEMRQPLGIAIVGGLIVSQMLTLYTTPVIYLYFDRFRLWAQGLWRRLYHRDRGALAPGAGE
ncbi:MAG TPA: efflux RND transporter permease subunit [Alphaproteobacteria bacterium]|nr:efflux RND transporter permease subunit [Alphaproteobacteria bacterium]